MIDFHELWADLRIMLLVSAIAMSLTWLLQQRTRNAGFVDVVWAALLAVSALFYGTVSEGAWLPRVIVACLAGIWGFRLANHLLSRVLHEAEDGRYAFLRTHWGDHQGKFFGFFMAQAVLVGLFSIPFWLAMRNPNNELSIWYVIGILFWVTSLVGESIADIQLARFRANSQNKGKTCRDGLWKYSRHPNYFFEWLHWFTYVAFCVETPGLWLSLLGPALMMISLCWVTGIPFVEAQSLRSRGEDYRHYQRTVSPLIPWFVKPDPRRADTDN
jgi:steroid 5-alpha reductase family enzyme